MMSTQTRQWTSREFEERRPLFKANYIELGFLALALWPFGLALVYWFECTFLKSAITSEHLMMWSSIGIGGVLALCCCAIVVEWTKAAHYNNLQKNHNALSHCAELLHKAMEDEEVVNSWVRDERKRPGLLQRLRSTVVFAEAGLRVEAYDDELVYQLIDRWIRRKRNSESASVVNADLHPVSPIDYGH